MNINAPPTNHASPYAKHWKLDPGVLFMNHGSFGACPGPVLDKQQALRDELEKEPLVFLDRTYEQRMDSARAALAEFLGAQADDLAFVGNATGGVNTVLRSIRLEPGDELLTTDHAYNACKNALLFVARHWNAKLVVAKIPFPLDHVDQAVDVVLEAVTPRTRMALIDHITSPTGLVLPIDRIVQALDGRGIDTLVDGAHAPGMLPLNLDEIGAAYYTGNAHKWLCAPKGAAFLHVRKDRQDALHPLSISHGLTASHENRNRFRLGFDWTGTTDVTPFLCIPEAIRFLKGLLPGGWPALRQNNRDLALRAQSLLSETLKITPPCPAEMIGSLVAVPLPVPPGFSPPDFRRYDPIQSALFERHRIEALVTFLPDPPRRLLRVSAQIYNTLRQFEVLADALRELMQETET